MCSIFRGVLTLSKQQTLILIHRYLDELAQSHSNLVTVETYGQSFEGRPLKAIKISSGGTNKPVIFVEAGIHAREWIAPALALYIINQLVENSNNSDMIQTVDWIIVPIVNPDGYEHTHASNRLWRKTRSNYASSLCLGADGNRNWDIEFAGPGTSRDPCAETYHGVSAFSEPETSALSKYIRQHLDRIKFYLSVHSFGQYLLYPFGHTSQLPPDYRDLHSLGQQGTQAIEAVAGTRYRVGNIVEVLYPAAGGSIDWVKGILGVKYSYTIELPGGGIFGFDLPPSKIEPVVQETFPAIKVWHKHVVENLL